MEMTIQPFKILNKDDLHYITQNITPEEAQYVAGVSTLMNDVGNEYKSRWNNADNTDDEKNMVEKECKEVQANILIISKLFAYNAKFANAVYACKSDTYKYKIQDMQYYLKDTIDECIKVLQSNPYYENQELLYNLTLPIDNDPLTLLNSMKETVYDYLATTDMNKQKNIELAEDRALCNVLDGLLRRICKSIYEVRLAKAAEYDREDELNKIDNGLATFKQSDQPMTTNW